MLMKNFEYFIPIFFFAIVAVAILHFMLCMRYKYLIKLCKINLLRRQQKMYECFFLSVLPQKIIRIIKKMNRKPKSPALAGLAVGRVDKAVSLLRGKKEAYSLFLLAHVNPRKAYAELKRKPKIWQEKTEYIIYFALLAEKFFDFDNVQKALRKIPHRRLKGVLRAYYEKAAAGQYLREADMLSASQCASSALKYFQKHNMQQEEAEVYLLLAEIYRISCVNDVAQTMIESAIKIYKQQNLKLFTARATAVMGMLMLFENRYEEAEDKFSKALEICDNPQTTAEIINQTVLLYIACKNKKQLKTAKLAHKLHNQHKNKRGEALSLQLLGQIYAGNEKWKSACGYVRKAQDIYAEQRNYSALCECLYLEACALYRLQRYLPAEKKLREILDIAKLHQNNFHYANAYSLLGLIYLKTGDLQRAKVLFQQSLGLEQTNNRSQGMIADYVDLALIEQLRGDDISARSNLKTALEYAKQTEDESLIEMINKRVQNL